MFSAVLFGNQTKNNKEFFWNNKKNLQRVKQKVKSSRVQVNFVAFLFVPLAFKSQRYFNYPWYSNSSYTCLDCFLKGTVGYLLPLKSFQTSFLMSCRRKAAETAICNQWELNDHDWHDKLQKQSSYNLCSTFIFYFQSFLLPFCQDSVR